MVADTNNNAAAAQTPSPQSADIDAQAGGAGRAGGEKAEISDSVKRGVGGRLLTWGNCYPLAIAFVSCVLTEVIGYFFLGGQVRYGLKDFLVFLLIPGMAILWLKKAGKTSPRNIRDLWWVTVVLAAVANIMALALTVWWAFLV